MALHKCPRAYSGYIPVAWLINLAIVSMFVLALYDYHTICGSLTNIPEAVHSGLLDLSTAYKEKFVAKDIEPGVLRYTIWLYILSPLMLPLVVAYWKRLSMVTKIGAVLVKIFELGTWIAIGTMKGIADTFVLLPVLILCAYPHLIVRQMSIRKKLLFGILATACIIIIFAFFTLAKNADKFEVSKVSGANTLRHEVYSALPPWLGTSSVMLTNYMVQGYHGLDLSFSQPFVWAYGGGHSPFVLGQLIHDAQGNTALSLSYPARVEMSEDWEMMVNWHSIYPWIASDLTFPGALLFVFGLGYLFGLAWIDWLVKRNPLSFALFGQLSIILLYFPCNNSQILGNLGVIGFVMLVAMWILTRTNHMMLNRKQHIFNS